jgi:hypothetical protein
VVLRPAAVEAAGCFDMLALTQAGLEAHFAAIEQQRETGVYMGVLTAGFGSCCAVLCRELDCLQATPITAVYKGHVRFSSDIIKR